jgi:hypothetical protein
LVHQTFLYQAYPHQALDRVSFHRDLKRGGFIGRAFIARSAIVAAAFSSPPCWR